MQMYHKQSLNLYTVFLHLTRGDNDASIFRLKHFLLSF